MAFTCRRVSKCLLIIVGATPEGRKELVGLTDGMRDTGQTLVGAAPRFEAAWAIDWPRARGRGWRARVLASARRGMAADAWPALLGAQNRQRFSTKCRTASYRKPIGRQPTKPPRPTAWSIFSPSPEGKQSTHRGDTHERARLVVEQHHGEPTLGRSSAMTVCISAYCSCRAPVFGRGEVDGRLVVRERTC